MRKIWVKIKLFGKGFFIHTAINAAFAALASLMTVCLGFKIAFVVFFFINFIKNFLLIFWYDNLKEDYFTIEDNKKNWHERESTKIVLTLIRKKSRVTFEPKKLERFLIILILVVWDPAYAAVYARDGYHRYDGLSKKVLLVFIISTLLNTLFLTGGIGSLLNLIFKN